MVAILCSFFGSLAASAEPHLNRTTGRVTQGIQPEAGQRLHPAPAAAPISPLLERVVILGASVSAGEKAASPGWLLARHLGAPESSISVFADGGAESDQHLGALETIARLRPTLIVALDLFYHDFKFSLFLSDSKKKYLRDFIDRLHATGAPVLLGNIPSLVLLRHEHVNRYLEALAPEFPNLILVDVRSLNEALDDGIPVRVAGRELLLKRQDVFADREHPNPLGSAFLANVLLEGLKARVRGLGSAAPIDLSPFLPPDGSHR
jgi:hypothetical protein